MMEKTTEQTEIDGLRDEVIRRMADTPPKPKNTTNAGLIMHYSDCAVNNGPAYEAGPCTCKGFKAER